MELEELNQQHESKEVRKIKRDVRELIQKNDFEFGYL
jgi:hypothetical protein